MSIESLEDLKTAVQGIVVKDYGDFKRKTILYLNRYSETIDTSEAEVRRELFKLKWHIQFHPTGEIEPTRNWTLTQLDQLAI